MKKKNLGPIPTVKDDANIFFKFCLQNLGVNPQKDMTIFCENEITFNAIVPTFRVWTEEYKGPENFFEDARDIEQHRKWLENPRSNFHEKNPVRENLLPLVKIGYSFIANEIKNQIELKTLHQ